MKTEIAIIGGGPAGLAAAVAARKAGVEDILIIERDNELGGILNQCIHNGFGLHTFKEELTGPEYAQRYIRKVEELQIPYMLHTIVVDIGEDKVITVMNKERGMFRIEAKAVILAMGCRERSRGALNIPGFRPAGIYSAGTVLSPQLRSLEKLLWLKPYCSLIFLISSGNKSLCLLRYSLYAFTNVALSSSSQKNSSPHSAHTRICASTSILSPHTS